MRCKNCKAEMYVSFEDTFIIHYDCPECGTFLKKMKIDPHAYKDESEKEEWIKYG